MGGRAETIAILVAGRPRIVVVLLAEGRSVILDTVFGVDRVCAPSDNKLGLVGPSNEETASCRLFIARPNKTQFVI